MIEFGRHRRKSADLDLTPLIDVVFQLLVFFLLTSAAMAQSIPVDLPEASTGESIERVLAITVEADGTLYLEGKQVPRARLPAAIAAAKREITADNPKADIHAVIAADGALAHARVVDVIDVLRQQGITQLGFQVEARPPEDAP